MPRQTQTAANYAFMRQLGRLRAGAPEGGQRGVQGSPLQQAQQAVARLEQLSSSNSLPNTLWNINQTVLEPCFPTQPPEYDKDHHTVVNEAIRAACSAGRRSPPLLKRWYEMAGRHSRLSCHGNGSTCMPQSGMQTGRSQDEGCPPALSATKGRCRPGPLAED